MINPTNSQNLDEAFVTTAIFNAAEEWDKWTSKELMNNVYKIDYTATYGFKTLGDATVTPAVMDLQNIATHELGHGVGLNDVYDSACSEVTMYGYSDFGETKKRTLEQPNITRLQTLYGV